MKLEYRFMYTGNSRLGEKEQEETVNFDPTRDMVDFQEVKVEWSSCFKWIAEDKLTINFSLGSSFKVGYVSRYCGDGVCFVITKVEKEVKENGSTSKVAQ